ncbi:hypothetical protein CBER1_09903 [Cercospora berteroae]|uniref:RRM domain-containing protein n=1 Tax=Cercospora berteroae TaxID=357750 RepID=A0A2S6BXF7_9PEZI|nr:hypothetical protein CBER1_09903 [Cercospora berteroae]
MASAVAAPGAIDVATRTAPSQSLYIQNLPEKLQKHDLKRNLYMLFTTYGPVLDVTAMKGSKMRGQAHVLFRDANTATQAMRHCQGYDFFGKEMKITYSKNRSHTLAKLTGTFHEEQQAANAAKTGPTTGASSLPAPPGAPPAGLPPPPGLPQKPNGGLPKPPGLEPTKGGAESAPSPAVSAGQKRQRDESDDEGGDAPMEEDSDGGEMEMSDSD